MPNIFARSPYIISVNEAGQIRTKIEIFIYNYGGTLPATPNYTLSKYIPSSNNTETIYNVSPLLREYIKNINPEVPFSYGDKNPQTYCIYSIDLYKDTGSGWLYVNTYDGLAFDGYTEYMNGVNDEPTTIGLKDEGTYYFPSGISYVNFPNVSVLCDGGVNVHHATVTNDNGSALEYDLTTYTTPVVVAPYSSSIKSIVIYDHLGNVKATYNFKPIEECRYTPVKVDYVNKYGAWDKYWFFKTSTNTITTSSKTYNTMQSSWDYNPRVGSTSVINKTGREKIRLSSGFVEEAVNSQIRQIMLSETILIDGKPAILKTDSVELFKHINQKQINYTMEFEYSFDLVNNML